MTTTRSTSLPVPRDALLELGLTEEQIEDAEARAPLVCAFQADKHPDAWFDVDRARRALKALGAFKHTKGRWAGVSMRLGEGLDPWQVVWVLAPVFGWVYFDAEVDRVVRVIEFGLFVSSPLCAAGSLPARAASPSLAGAVAMREWGCWGGAVLNRSRAAGWPRAAGRGATTGPGSRA